MHIFFLAQAELGSLKEAESSDRAEWERECRARISEEWKEREKSIENRLRSEAELEMEKTVKRLEAELDREKKGREAEEKEKVGLDAKSKIEFPWKHIVGLLFNYQAPACQARI